MYHVLCWFIIFFRLLSVIITFSSEFQTVTELWAFFNFRTCPRVNCILRNQLAGDVLNLVAYRLWKLRRATRTVHNREAVCVVACGGIFENQL